jgi:hypothetical protein
MKQMANSNEPNSKGCNDFVPASIGDETVSKPGFNIEGHERRVVQIALKNMAPLRG